MFLLIKLFIWLLRYLFSNICFHCWLTKGRKSVILKTETDEIKNPLDVFLHFAIYVIS